MFDTPKTANSRRTIPLPRGTVEDLLRWKSVQRSDMAAAGASYPILCTPGENGRTLYAPDFPNLQITAPTMDAGLLEMKEKLHKALRQYKYPPAPTRQEQIVVPATGFLLLIRVA